MTTGRINQVACERYDQRMHPPEGEYTAAASPTLPLGHCYLLVRCYSQSTSMHVVQNSIKITEDALRLEPFQLVAFDSTQIGDAPTFGESKRLF